METEIKEEVVEEISDEMKKKMSEENKLIESLNLKIKELENKVLYKDAELINYRKRKDEETSNMLKYCNSNLILQILTVVDDLERAIKLDDDILDDEVSKFLGGIKMIYARLTSILDSFEVKEIDCINKEFNATYEQAVLTTKEENILPGIVLEVLQKGYMYKDKVIRPAMVRVSE